MGSASCYLIRAIQLPDFDLVVGRRDEVPAVRREPEAAAIQGRAQTLAARHAVMDHSCDLSGRGNIVHVNRWLKIHRLAVS